MHTLSVATTGDALHVGLSNMLNGLDLFSGIGGLSIALKPWVRTVAYCERDRYAQAVLLSRITSGELDRAPIWDDVTSLRGAMLPSIDIIFGGFPCQDISVAGNGAGLDGERSGLFFEVIRLTRDIRPAFVFLENVPAIHHRGLERVLMEFTQIGYDCRWTIISAGELGAPHLRERWWLLAYSNSERLQVSRTELSAKSKGQPRTGYAAECILQRQVWSQSPSELCRVDDGIRPKTHRLRCLGNAVVPIQAREAFKLLSGIGDN